MARGKHDPRDTKNPAQARYQEFTVAYASALVLAFCLRDVGEAGIIDDLARLWDFAVENAEYHPDEDDTMLGEIDLDSTIDATELLGPGFERISVQDALTLHDQLFPEGVNE
jgi:hypothetical protein